MENRRPTELEYDPFYAGYVSLVPESDVLPVLRNQPRDLASVNPSSHTQYRTLEPEQSHFFRSVPLRTRVHKEGASISLRGRLPNFTTKSFFLAPEFPIGWIPALRSAVTLGYSYGKSVYS